MKANHNREIRRGGRGGGGGGDGGIWRGVVESYWERVGGYKKASPDS